MKRIILAMAIVALVFPTARRAEAEVGVSVDFFYNNLNDGGSWIEAGDYGYCWQPNVAVGNSSWRPYSDGYWAYTDVGWTWVSYEDFGWATYHYGRWARLRDQGWVWVPGREWGPAWVSWRTGGDYIGWAPLPPRYGGGGGELVYEGRPISSTVDIDFDIGPAYYNFVDVRYIGEPVLRGRIVQTSQNVTIINRTVNVTNITYNNSTVYNYGPDYNRVSAYSTRPIRRMTLQREANVDYSKAGRASELTKVQGDKLIVASPPVSQQPAQAQKVAPPKVVKTRIAKPEVETGWSGISDPKAKAEIQQKIKKEDPKSIPPPDVQAANPALLTAEPGAIAKPAAEASAAPVPAEAEAESSRASTPEEKAARRNKRGLADQSKRPGAAPAAGTAQPNAAAAPAVSPNDLKTKRQPAPRQLAQPTAVPDGSATPGALPNDNNRGKGKDKRAGNGQLNQPAAAPRGGAVTPEASVAPVQPSSDLKGRGKNRPAPTVEPTTSAPDGSASNASIRDNRPERDLSATPNGDNAGNKAAAREAKRNERAAGAPTAAPGQPVPGEAQRKAAIQRGPVAPQENASRPASAAQQGAGKPDREKKVKKGEATPSPSPAQ